MKPLSLFILLCLSLTVVPVTAVADTPPPGTVKAKLFTGDGATGITATGTALNVNITNSGGLSTVNQGTAGLESWLVEVTGSALPTNACQETGGHLASIDSKLSNPMPVSGTFWQTTQPVSGTITANAGSGTFLVDGSAHTQPVSGTFWQATQPISAAALPLPTGAATEATLGNVAADTLATASAVESMDLKTPALGQALAAGSVPVVLTAAQISTLTPPTTITANAGSGTFLVDGSAHPQPVTGTFWQATQPVSGSVTANIGTTNGLALDASVTALQVTQGSTTSGQSGNLAQGAVTTAAPTYTTGKTDPLSLTTSGALRIDGSGSTQPVSGTFWQATQPTSLATLPALTAGSALIGKVGIDQTTPGTTNGVQVNAALPAGTNVIGKVSIDQTTPGTTNLVALAANQSVNVNQINGVTPLMGNGTTGTGSQRVTIASDNTAFSVNAIPKTPAALTVKQAAITVGTSAVRLTNDGLAPPSTRVLLVAQLLSTSTANCYFGSSGVTTTSTTRGVQMFAGQTFSFAGDAGDYYAICDASSQTFYITEQE